jgi:hypothetical protein
MTAATANFDTLPENIRKAKQVLEKTFSDAPEFLDYIEQKALFDVISKRAKKTKYNISQRARQAGAIGLGYDLLKGSFNFLKNIAFPSQTERLKDIKEYGNASSLNRLKDMKGYGAASSLIPQTEPPKADKSKTYFDKPVKVLIDGITDEGYRDLLQKLPDIIKRGILDAQKDAPDRYKEILDTIKSSKEKKTEGGGFSLLEALGLSRLLGGGRLLLTLLKFFTGVGGIFAAIYAITTSDPWKGLSKLVAQGLLSVSGISKMIQGFVGNIITKLVDLPGKLFLSFSVGIEKIFGKVAGGKVFDIGVKVLESAIPKALKTGLIFLRKVPIIGTLLTIGVAVDRIRKGDYFGGFLDVLSGIAAMFPGIGTGIALAIDGLNAFLDYKAGGIGPGKPSKLGIVSDWITGATKWISKKLENIPYFGSLARAFEHMQKGEWLEGLKSLGHSMPFISELLELIGINETTAEEKPVDTSNLQKTVNLLAKLNDWIFENIIDYLTGWMSNIYNWAHDTAYNLATSVKNAFTGKTTELPQTPKPAVATVTVNGKTMSLDEWQSQNKPLQINVENEMQNEMLKTWQQRADIWQDMQEESQKPTILLNNETTSLNNQTLDQIAGNTEITNNNLKVLGEAILKLAQVFNDKSAVANNNFFVNGQQQQNYPSASEIAASNRDPIRPIRMQFMPQMA